MKKYIKQLLEEQGATVTPQALDMIVNAVELSITTTIQKALDAERFLNQDETTTTLHESSIDIALHGYYIRYNPIDVLTHRVNEAIAQDGD